MKTDMDTVSRSTKFTATVAGHRINVDLTIYTSYKASFDFTLCGTPYSFTVVDWSRRGFTKFATMFFNHMARDAEEFGTYEVTEDPMSNITTMFNMTTPQKLNIITKGVKDIMSCVDTIVTKQQRSVLDYAVRYNDIHHTCETYVDFITVRACECIMHSHFLAPNIIWDMVRFSD